ncbi:hypothetical protein AVEN_111513-1 [Araneus ventricosus]|uniref:Uncharacterized protein n=1 Tax=Araneus ventricosus TaxID=182803 RepID=A0A4Y2TW86_ARAVE|nr:hypothetical protein AVEN_111513-1 [Araneus ventricosus]
MSKMSAFPEFFIRSRYQKCTDLPLNFSLSLYFGENKSAWRMRKSAEGFGSRHHTLHKEPSLKEHGNGLWLAKMIGPLPRLSSKRSQNLTTPQKKKTASYWPSWL